MNIVINEKLVKRNARIASIAMFSGFLVLIAGMIISFRMPLTSGNSTDNARMQFNIFLGVFTLGFILTQVGIYFNNRWGRKPPPHQLIDLALKGLDGRHTIYHYTLPASHVLIGPTGVWVLSPRYQRGTITYGKGRWHQRGGGLLYGYLKIFGQEGLGRPDIEVQGEIESLKKGLAKLLPEGIDLPEIQPVLVFTDPKVEINIPEEETPPAATVHISKLKDLVRKSTKGKSLPLEKVKQIQDALGS